MRISDWSSDVCSSDLALGGAEGHTAIMARSLGLPAVVGVAGLLPTVRFGDMLIVDGSNGLVVVNPTAARLAGYERRLKDMAREVRALERLRDVPAKTRDGQRVTLQLNLELPRELEPATGLGAEGIRSDERRGGQGRGSTGR